MKIRRTLLWIPGNNPAMIANAPVLRADTICLDNEDAVQPADKDASRIVIRNYLSSSVGRRSVELATRINDISTPYWMDDIRTVIPGMPDVLIIPKVEHSSDIDEVHALVSEVEAANGIPVGHTRFFPILETALGIENAFLIASNGSGRLDGMMMGGEDLVTSLGGIRTEESQEIDYARKRFVVACRAAGLKPIDTVYPNVENIDGLIRDTEYSRQLGFAGRAVVSPRHVPYVNRIFSPSEAEIFFAKEVLAAYEEGRKNGTGAVSLHGKMIDAPMIPRAKQVLEIAKMIQGGNS